MERFNGAKPLIPVSERDALRKAIIKIKARKTGQLKFLKTAWPKFNDAFCDGLEWRTITVVGARPGTGKTLFMEQLVSDIIDINTDQEFRVLKFQMEMLDETSGVRKLSQHTGKDYNTLMSKEESLEEDDHEVGMGLSALKSSVRSAKTIYEEIKKRNLQELEGWVQHKLTLASDYLETVARYMEDLDEYEQKDGKSE
jgi:replicative DNA helicase